LQENKNVVLNKKTFIPAKIILDLKVRLIAIGNGYRFVNYKANDYELFHDVNQLTSKISCFLYKKENLI